MMTNLSKSSKTIFSFSLVAFFPESRRKSGTLKIIRRNDLMMIFALWQLSLFFFRLFHVNYFLKLITWARSFIKFSSEIFIRDFHQRLKKKSIFSLFVSAKLDSTKLKSEILHKQAQRSQTYGERISTVVSSWVKSSWSTEKLVFNTRRSEAEKKKKRQKKKSKERNSMECWWS